MSPEWIVSAQRQRDFPVHDHMFVQRTVQELTAEEQDGLAKVLADAIK